MDEVEYDALVHDLIDGALRAADQSPNVRVEEPYLVALTFLIGSQPAYEKAGVETLCASVPEIDTTVGVIELLEFCMHVLRPQRLITTVCSVRDAAKSQLVSGHVPRAWNTARKCERILEALSEPWDNGEIYASFYEPT